MSPKLLGPHWRSPALDRPEAAFTWRTRPNHPVPSACLLTVPGSPGLSAPRQNSFFAFAAFSMRARLCIMVRDFAGGRSAAISLPPQSTALVSLLPARPAFFFEGGARQNDVLPSVRQKPVNPAGASNTLLDVVGPILKLPGSGAIWPAPASLLRKGCRLHTIRGARRCME